jgi:solute carrier family 7 (L-type amino acid transporter), member 9/15
MSPITAHDGSERPLLAHSRDQDDTYGGTEQHQHQQTGTFARNLGALDAFAIIISIVIGSGIFTSPGSIDTNVPSPGTALAVWLVGGVLAWTGAATMAELGTAIPGEGGVQPYLKYIYGDIFGHLAAWTWVVAVMPATLAILSIVFVESIFSAAGVTDRAASIWHKLLSVLIMVVMNLANSISTKASTRLNKFFVTTKFVSIFAVVLAGLVVLIIQLARPDSDVGGGDWIRRSWFAARDSVAPDGSVTHWQDVGTWELLGHLSAALYGALWAYSGWEKGIYVSAELSNPVRQLPLAINTAIPTIIACFLATNAAYYILLPWDVVSTTDSVAVVRRKPLPLSPLPLQRSSMPPDLEERDTETQLTDQDRNHPHPRPRFRHPSCDPHLPRRRGLPAGQLLRSRPHGRRGSKCKLAAPVLRRPRPLRLPEAAPGGRRERLVIPGEPGL